MGFGPLDPPYYSPWVIDPAFTCRRAIPGQDPLTLRPLTVQDETQARAAHAELLEEGFTFLLGDHANRFEVQLLRPETHAERQGA
jgi:hypothetical protein